MTLGRTLSLLAIAMSTLGALGCGMEAVATGDPGTTGAPGSAGHAAAADGGAASLGKGGDSTPSQTTTGIDIGVDAGGTADAGGLASCTKSGGACAVTSDCCAGLSCTGEDEDRRCK